MQRSNSDPALSERDVAARLERLPSSAWHVRMRLIMGTATFFDAFDSLAIASALPVLVTMWRLSPQQIGLLIAIGFVGQAIGAIVFGRIAEHIGRVKTISVTVSIFAVMSLACSVAPGYFELLACRFVQGIGLGGEVPIAATYINEIANSGRRGRFFLLYECVFIVGILASSLIGAYVVPRFGYQWLFALGGVPALLFAIIRRSCPKSPRWLASRGRLQEASEALARIENAVAREKDLTPYKASALHEPQTQGTTRWSELFTGIYSKRTAVAWTLWFCSFFVSYGLTTWLPTIYRAQYGVSLQAALILGVFGSACVLIASLVCAFVIDSIGRRVWMTGAFVAAFVALFALAVLTDRALMDVVVLTTGASAAINTIAITLYLYTPESTRPDACAWDIMGNILAPRGDHCWVISCRHSSASLRT